MPAVNVVADVCVCVRVYVFMCTCVRIHVCVYARMYVYTPALDVIPIAPQVAAVCKGGGGGGG